MSDRRAFIEAICRDPDNDTARLVYADWLEDTADPPEPERAEFIRVQCELAALWPPEPFLYDWPTNRTEMMTGTPPNHFIGPHLDPGPFELPDGAVPEDAWIDFGIDGKTYPDLFITIERGQPGGLVLTRFRPHPRGPYPHRERLNWLKGRERKLIRGLWVTHGMGDVYPLSHFVCDGVSLDKAMMPRVSFARGFISSITCAADDWLAHADAIAWHPGQNRPCPETAQPVRKVTLTTWQTLMGNPVRFTKEHLAKLWPGIEFELPRTIDVPWVGDGQDYVATYTAAYEEMIAHTVRQFGIPPELIRSPGSSPE